jgi:RNA polymerase sigma-70 factor (ECF subfamily)
MNALLLAKAETVAETVAEAVAGPVSEAEARLRALVGRHFDVTFRLLRRLGVPASDLDDAMQEVIWVLSRKLDQVEPDRERAFMLSTAYRVASTLRRTLRRRREDPESLVSSSGAESDPEALLERRRARALLDRLLDQLPLEQRSVFVLFELERFTMVEIAEALGLRPGTVASRLRRARRAFAASVEELERKLDGGRR